MCKSCFALAFLFRTKRDEESVAPDDEEEEWDDWDELESGKAAAAAEEELTGEARLKTSDEAANFFARNGARSYISPAPKRRCPRARRQTPCL